MATDCPGEQVYASHGDAIYEGYIDFVDGAWVLTGELAALAEG